MASLNVSGRALAIRADNSSDRFTREAARSALGLAPVVLGGFLMAVAVAAATGFLTPFSTPTNLLVMTPGGYKFGDYARIGLPLLILILIASLLLLPVIWPI